MQKNQQLVINWHLTEPCNHVLLVLASTATQFEIIQLIPVSLSTTPNIH